MRRRKRDIPVFDLSRCGEVDRGIPDTDGDPMPLDGVLTWRQLDWCIPDTEIEDGVYVDIPEPEIPDGFRLVTFDAAGNEVYDYDKEYEEAEDSNDG